MNPVVTCSPLHIEKICMFGQLLQYMTRGQITDNSKKCQFPWDQKTNMHGDLLTVPQLHMSGERRIVYVAFHCAQIENCNVKYIVMSF